VRALQARKQSLERARLASQQLASKVDAAFVSGAAAALAQVDQNSPIHYNHRQ
jgi:hypothetical protein